MPVIIQLSPLIKRPESPPAEGTPMQELNYTPTAQDSLTTLIIITEEGAAKYFIVIKMDMAQERIAVLALPYNTAAVIGEKSDILSGFDAYGGTIMAAGAVEALTGIDINRTVRISAEDFIKSVNILGTVKYKIPYTLIQKDTANGVYINIPKGVQSLTGRDIYNMFGFANYKEGLDQRHKLQSDLTASLINQRMDKWLVEHSDKVFTTLINYMDTDISAKDYEQYLPAVTYLALKGENPAFPVFAKGDFTRKGFILSQQSKDTIAMYFNSLPAREDAPEPVQTTAE